MKQNMFFSRLLTFIMVFISSKVFASDHYIDDSEYDRKMYERYSRLDLENFEWICIVVGLILVIVGKHLIKRNNKVGGIFSVVGGLVSTPFLLIVIVSLISYAFAYVFPLAIIFLVLYAILSY